MNFQNAKYYLPLRNQTPVVGSPEPLPKDEEERSSLGSSPFGKKTQGDKEISTPNKSGFLFASASGALLTSQSVDTSSLGSSPFAQTTQGESQRFSSTGSHLFLSANGDNDYGPGDGDHEGPNFEPIIPLPDKINVKTVAQDEDIIFSHRAKLYRFVSEDKQWKERGVGDIKLLIMRNRQTGKMRVLMRRDQVLKLCANHQITSDMKLQPNAGSDRSWVWSTMADFSEQECRAEQLAVKFKSEDIAKQFKEKFEECQEMLQNQTPLKPQEVQKDEKAKQDLMAKFKPTEGSWECDICMVNNDSDKVECAACGSLKPRAEPNPGQKKEPKSLVSFSSGASSSEGGFAFGSGGARQGDTNPVFAFGTSNKTSNLISGFSFTFASLKEGGSVCKQQTEDTQKSVPSLHEQTPDKEADKPEDDQESQRMLKNQTAVKPTQEEQKHEEAKEDLMAKFKPAEGSWECDICLVRNNSDKVECAACGSLKPGAEPSKEQTKDVKPLFSFGTGTLSSGGGFSFRSVGTSQGDANKVSVFGSFHQKSSSSSGISFSFGSVKQGRNLSAQQTKDTNKTIDQTPDKGADKTKNEQANVQEAVDITKEAQNDDNSKEEKTYTQARSVLSQYLEIF